MKGGELIPGVTPLVRIALLGLLQLTRLLDPRMRLCDHRPMFGIVMCDAKFVGYSDQMGSQSVLVSRDLALR